MLSSNANRYTCSDRTGKRPLRRAWLGMLLCLATLCSPLAQNQAQDSRVVLLDLEGVIGPATADYVERGLREAEEGGALAVILRMDTPGGLDTSMRAIVQGILQARLPVVSFVSPSGARAASAGTYILYASHIAAMAPATNLGAATPVQLGAPVSTPDEEGQQRPQSAMEKKVINDATAYLQGLAELRGRNAQWAEKAVREGLSLPARRALEEGVIDLIADDLDALLQALDGRSVTVHDQPRILQTAEAIVQSIEPDWRSRLLAVITNPTLAYILMLVGIYGLIFEFSNPGLGGPGIIGAVCLLLALYAFQVLPVSYLGVALIMLGMGLMAAEAFAPSFGILGIGGVASFIIGSIVLMDTDLPAFQIALPLILALAVASAVLLIAVLGMLARSRKQRVVSGVESLIGEVAVIEQISREQPMARLQGELWQVSADETLAVGDQVVVREIRGLTLVAGKVTIDKQEAQP